MSKLLTAFKLLKNERSEFAASILINFFKWLPDRLYLKLLYWMKLGKTLNLKNPLTFTEKLQWLKLYDRSPEYTCMVDKYEVKKYVAEIIGSEYIVPTIGVWGRPEDIDWNRLPDKFVLKTTHGGGGGGVMICKDKSSFSKEVAIERLNNSMATEIYSSLREWPYKNVVKRIIAEKYIVPENNSDSKDLPDYKFFCFNGYPKYCQVIRNRSTQETIDFYDMDWNHMEFVGLTPRVKNGIIPVAKPQKLELMKEICMKLATDIPFVRVDLYAVEDKVYFGELTFYPASGLGVIEPELWNLKLGNQIKLPNSIV